jgi:hypothetical protein
MNTRKAESQDNDTYRNVCIQLNSNKIFSFVCFFFKFLWNEVCDDVLTETKQHFVTPKLITKLMYAFRDIQVRIEFFLINDYLMMI